MKRATIAIAFVVLTASIVAAGCSGSSNADKTATVSGADATATFEAIIRRTFGATSAVADVTLGAETLKISGGNCRAGSNDRFFILKAGAPNADEYLYVLLGRYPASKNTAKITTGGGTFVAADGVGVQIRHKAVAIKLAPDTAKVTLAADLSSGTVSGTTTDGVAYSAKWTC